MFNQPADMGWFIEMIEPGAFDEALTRSDARALFNHNPDNLLARQSAGTLTLRIDDKGLYYEFEAPDTTLGNDLLKMIERGDLRESSFAFIVKRQRWEEERQPDGTIVERRIIEEVEEVFDVAPVTYPAYTQTSVAKRSFEEWRKQQQGQKDMVKGGIHPAALRLIF